MSATEVAAWFALAGVMLLWVFVFVVLVIAFRAWHKIAPQVTPLLAMFAPPAPTSSSSPNSGSVTKGVTVDRGGELEDSPPSHPTTGAG